MFCRFSEYFELFLQDSINSKSFLKYMYQYSYETGKYIVLFVPVYFACSDMLDTATLLSKFY